MPSPYPTAPTPYPTPEPSPYPTPYPTPEPSPYPTFPPPTMAPTGAPSKMPTTIPTHQFRTSIYRNWDNNVNLVNLAGVPTITPGLISLSDDRPELPSMIL